jgi:RHS repeat-associated protein
MSWVQKTPSKKFATTYNSRGKLESINDGGNNFVFSYGIFGNKIKEAQTLTDFGKPIEFNFVTDINGLNTEKILKVDGKIDHANKYEVDTINRISTISQTVNNTSRNVNIQYDAFGQLSQQTRLDSGKQIIVTKNKFDDSGRLINISHTGNNKTYADYDITWDQANRITDFDFTYLNGPAKKSESKYLYDKTSQLINASYNFMPNEKYDFDLNGNRKKAEIQGKNQQYETSEYNRLLSDENYRYEYDLEGNRITKTNKTNNETTKYTWDNRNRLIRVETPTEAIEYIYDYQNRLVKRTENITNQQYFIHDDWQIILQFDNKNLIPTHRYLWGTKQDELICDNENWTLGDHLNTIRDIVKSDGNVAAHLEYNSFGKLISETKNNDSIFFAYTGKLTDKISDLQWNINRWYDSNVGKWVSEDPIGFEGGDLNLYSYVDNIPIVLIDVRGKNSSICCEYKKNSSFFIEEMTCPFSKSSAQCCQDNLTNFWGWGWSVHRATRKSCTRTNNPMKNSLKAVICTSCFVAIPSDPTDAVGTPGGLIVAGGAAIIFACTADSILRNAHC